MYPRTPNSPPPKPVITEILDDRGRRSDDRAAGVVDHLTLPELLAGPGVEGGQVPVEPRHEDLAVGVCDAAIVDVTTRVLLDTSRHFGRIAPANLAGSGVDREHVL